MSSHSTRIVHNSKGRSIIIFGLLFGGISTILSTNIILGVVSMTPYIFAYYRHGGKVYISSIVCGLFFLLLLQIVYQPSTSGTTISSEVSTYIQEDQDTQLQENESPGVYAVLFQYIMSVIGIGLFLVCSKLKWVLRLIIVAFFISLGAIPLIPLMQATAYEILNSSATVDVQLLGDTFIVLLPVMATVMFLSNMIFATMALSIRAKVPYHVYIEYVLRRIMLEKITLPPLALILLVGMIWILGYAKQGVLHNMQLFFISALILLLVCFSMLGVARIYDYLIRIINIRATWYFFSCCIIMLLPFINIFAILASSIVGVRYNYSRYRYRTKIKKKEKSDESYPEK